MNQSASTSGGHTNSGGNTIEIKLKGFSTFPHTASKWNTNEDIASLLVSAQNHQEWLREEVVMLAPSGSQILYRRGKEGMNASHYKQDGFLWKKRKDGKLPREDHMKLKVKGIELIYANYVHSALVPTFHRRAYWLLSNPDVILVHYLNVSPPPSADNKDQSLGERLVNTIRPHASLPRQDLVEQLTAMLCSPVMNSNCVDLPASRGWVEGVVDEVKTLFYAEMDQRNSQEGSTSYSSTPTPKKKISLTKNSQLPDKNADRPSSSSHSQILHIPSNVQQIIVQYQVQAGHGETRPPLVIGTTSRSLNPDPAHSASTPVLLSVDSGPITESQQMSSVQQVSVSPSSLGVMEGGGGGGASDFSGDNHEFQVPIGRSSSCSSAFRKGMSSFAMCRQPSAFSDTVDDVFINGAALNAYVAIGSNQQQGEESVTSGSHHEDSAYNSFSDPKDLDYLGLIQDREEDRAISHYRENPVLGGGGRGVRPLAETLGLNAEDMGDTLNTIPLVDEDEEESFGVDSMALLQRYLNDSMTEGSGNVNKAAREEDTMDSRSPHRFLGGERAIDIATILDYSPDWSYTEGGVKVLIGGPWYLSGHEYSCLFDGQEVPASLVQTGIIRCYCPGHEASCVGLRVSCDGQVISNSVNFTYRDRMKEGEAQTQSASSETKDLTGDQRFVLGLLERFEHMEKYLEKPDNDGNAPDRHERTEKTVDTSRIPSISDLEDRFVRICDRMSRLEWNSVEQQDLPDILLPRNKHASLAHHKGMKLLHLAAALGFSRLIAALLRWRAEKPSSILNTEIDPICRDDLGRTPLFLACQFGKLGSARLLAEYNEMALRIGDADGVCPLKEAARRNHRSLVDNLVSWAHAKDRRENEQKVLLSSQSCGKGSGRVLDSTTLWVLTGGECVTDQGSATTQHTPLTHTGMDQRKEDLERKLSSEDGGNVQIRTGRRGSIVRERTKRVSVEDLDALLEPKVTRQTWTDRESPLSVEIPMDVEVPESPDMVDMWEQLTSPGAVVHEGARAQMASLAQQIIDALPDRIKQEGLPEEAPHSSPQLLGLSPQSIAACLMEANRDGAPGTTPGLSAFVNYRLMDSMTPSSCVESPGGSSVSLLMTPPRLQQHQQQPYSSDGGTGCGRGGGSPGGRGEMESGSEVDQPGSPTSTVELGAFFNAYRMRKSPLERHFQDLALNDREQRELYEAARIIQTAFRQYKSRVIIQRNERQLESERHAAIVIQSYYRRYKQYCYFKKLHRAALLIQKHFRLHKASKDHHRRRGGTSWHSSAPCSTSGFDLGGTQDEEEFWEFAAAAAAADVDSESCFRMKVNPEELAQWRKHLAAIRIQHAYRGHYMRKRQAAARKIQKFMRESRQKLLRDRDTGGSGGTRVQVQLQLSSQHGCRGIPDR